jgi:hypothetical protein
MIFEQALMTYLLDQSAITALVNTKIYFTRAPQDVDQPYIVVFKVSGPRVHSHDGGSGLANPQFQLSIFASSYGTAKEIAAAIQSALQGYTGTMGGGSGVFVGNCMYVNEVDQYEVETELHHIAVDYEFFHEE